MLFSDEDGENDYQDYGENNRRDDNPDPIHALACWYLVFLSLFDVLFCLDRIIFSLLNVLVNLDQVCPLLMYFLVDSDCNVTCIYGYLFRAIEVLFPLLNDLLCIVNLALNLKLLNI